MNQVKWRALLGLVLVYIAVFFYWNWLFGVILLLWLLPDLRSGETHFFERLSRQENPVIYRAVVVTWLGLSIYLILEPLLYDYPYFVFA